ncbi:hypothetical protein C8Q75DRAFT_737984 [Abortiporus biennis]|nr:hypothetical protein C8Q75DRAFT_737984 [Abortiporus biennis]
MSCPKSLYHSRLIGKSSSTRQDLYRSTSGEQGDRPAPCCLGYIVIRRRARALPCDVAFDIFMFSTFIQTYPATLKMPCSTIQGYIIVRRAGPPNVIFKSSISTLITWYGSTSRKQDKVRRFKDGLQVEELSVWLSISSFHLLLEEITSDDSVETLRAIVWIAFRQTGHDQSVQGWSQGCFRLLAKVIHSEDVLIDLGRPLLMSTVTCIRHPTSPATLKPKSGMVKTSSDDNIVTTTGTFSMVIWGQYTKTRPLGVQFVDLDVWKTSFDVLDLQPLILDFKITTWV